MMQFSITGLNCHNEQDFYDGMREYEPHATFTNNGMTQGVLSIRDADFKPEALIGNLVISGLTVAVLPE